MSNLLLGLDLGPSSVGWALVDEADRRIVASGARIFPEGVDRDQQGGEKSKSAARRTSRGMRRQIARRARRKRQLHRVLGDAGLLPTERAELNDLYALNPYLLRARALDEPLRPSEIGRILLHICQRRGFRSNRKADKARATETKGMLAEISELARAVREAGCRTLGEYLSKLDGSFDHALSDDADRVRHRHTRRDMYEAEFEAIWEAQRKHHPSLLTDCLKEGIRNTIFFQRDMYWPKSVIGYCELEPKLKRCPRADRAAQRFRMLQEVNNIRLLDSVTGEERPLTGEERSLLLEYLGAARQRTFDQIRKKLDLAEHVRFNYERAERNKLKGHETDAALSAKKVLGKRWKDLADETKDAIVNILCKADGDDKALCRLAEEGELTPEEAERALAVNLPDGHMSYSREAIGRLLPHLERGLLLMADDASNSALHAAGYLRPDEREVRQRRFLPPAPDLPNPIVRQALVETRKLVNAIIREHGLPARIHVELAREAKKSSQQRREMLIDNAARRRLREDAAAEVEKLGVKPTRAAVDRFVLWREQQESCPYCGRKISQVQLFSGESDIDHILPRWRSLDNSLANRVVSHWACNTDKGDRTPREWLEDSDPERYQLVLRLAERLPYGKRRKFIQKDIVLDDFVNRQLTDTAYISRAVTQYLKCLGAKIVTPRGQMTAELRYSWGLNTILDTKGRGEKNRADHRHHAVDAIVIALTSYSHLHALANARGKHVPPPWEGFREDAERAVMAINVSHRVRRGLSGAMHEETFYGATQKATGEIVEDPGEARRPWAKGWVEYPKTYVRRKPVTEIKNRKHLEKVRDTTIREILRQHLRVRSVDPDQAAHYPSNVFKGENTPRMSSGVPIKKVRMLEDSQTFRRVSDRRAYQHVKPGRNHHVVYRAGDQGKDETWTAGVVPMWDAALRVHNGRPIVDRSDNECGRFVMSLSIGEMFEIDADNAERQLCVVRKITQRSGSTPPRLYYKPHQDARDLRTFKKELERLKLSPRQMNQRNARKVLVDPLGHIRWAND